MSLIKELTTMRAVREGAVKDEMMDLIDKAIKNAKCHGMSWDAACVKIAKEFHKLDSHKLASGMDDEALIDLIKGQYDEDPEASADNAVTEDGEPQGGETQDPASTTAAPQPQGQTPSQQPAPAPAQPKIISQAGGFSVETTDDEQVSIMKGNQTIATMPLVIWKQLTR